MPTHTTITERWLESFLEGYFVIVRAVWRQFIRYGFFEQGEEFMVFGGHEGPQALVLEFLSVQGFVDLIKG